MSKKLNYLIAASFALSSANGFALGLGEIELNSALNQPFEARIKLVSSKQNELEELRVGLASNADFERIGAVRSPFLNSLKFEIVRPQGGKPYIKVTSNEPIREPFVDFILEANWPAGRLLREYTVLLDPPTVTTERAAPVQAPAKAEAPVSRPLASAPTRPSTLASGGGIIQPTNVASGVASGDLVFGPTQSTDTLWGIADAMRPDNSISVQQMMMALLKENPQAFTDNNINNLKAGQTLSIKDRSVITQLTAAEAKRETQAQYQAWLAAKEARRAAQGDVVTQQSPVAEQSAPAAAGAGANTGAAATPQGGLRLLAEDELEDDNRAATGGVADVEGKTEIDLLREELELNLIAAQGSREQNKQLQSRVVALEEQIAAMQRLLEIKDNSLSQLQQKLGEEGGELGAAAEQTDSAEVQRGAQTAPVIEGVPEAETAVDTAVDTPTATSESADVMPEVAATGDESPLIEPGEMEVPVDDAQTASEQAAADETLAGGILEKAAGLGGSVVDKVSGFFSEISFGSLMDALRPQNILERYRENPLVFRIVSGVIVFLIVVGLWHRRRKAAAEERFDEFNAPRVLGEADKDPAEKARQAESGPRVGTMEDPAEEAEFYRSCHRYDRAEAVLKQAIDNEPARNDLRTKLLEVYHAARNMPAFVAAAEMYYPQLRNEAAWSNIRAMGAELAPDHQLFGADDMGAEFDNIDELSLGELPDLDAIESETDSEDYADIDVEMSEFADEADRWEAERANEEGEQASAASDTDDSFDLLDDIDEAEIDKLVDDSSDSSEAFGASSEELENELLGMVEDDNSAAAEEVSSEESLASEAPAMVENMADRPRASKPLAREDNVIEFDNGAAKAQMPIVERAMNGKGERSETTGSAGNDVDYDYGFDEPLAPNHTFDGAESEQEGYDTSLFAGVDVVATKLDLAKAYLDMGDHDGARSILGEVVSEGNDEQKREAQELIGQL